MHAYRYEPTQSNKNNWWVQDIIEISTDTKTVVAKNAAMQYDWIEKEEVEFPALHYLVAREFI